MGPEVVNKNKNCVFKGPYAGRDLYIAMYQDNEREFVVTHNANIKPVSYFTGRETELQELRQRVEEGRKSVLVSGMGGIGKTHICRKLFEEYLNKHAGGENGPFRYLGYIEYNGDMGSSLQSCLKFKEQERQEQNQEAAWRELEYLAADGKLLLFVDNVDRLIGEDSGLQRLRGIPGAVVLTSRQASFSDEFEPYRIGFLDMGQCKEVYERIRFRGSARKVALEEVEDLEYIIENLAGRYTITVEFLAHLACTKIWTVKRLREELEEKGFKMTFRKGGEFVNIQEAYEVLYDLSKLTEAEQNILEAFSVFPYIPLAAEICDEWLLADAGASEDDDILMGLYQKGWLQFGAKQENYALHPVFAQFICEKCKPELDRHLGLIDACRKNLKIPESGSVIECQKYIPYAENMIEKLVMGDKLELAGFISAVADLLYYVAEYKKAEALYEKSLKINVEVFGEGHPETAINYNNLALVYWSQGEYKKAEELYEKSLWINEKVLGEDHSNTITNCNNLALVYKNQGKYSEAEGLYKKVLQVGEKVIGTEHLNTAVGYNNLALVYISQGKYEQAEKLCKKSIYLSEKILGAEHPNIAIIYNSLAGVYEKQGKYSEAEVVYKRSLRISEKVLGENHPFVFTCYNNLAGVYKKQGKYNEAEVLYQKSLRISEKVLGEEHPDTATICNNLAEGYGRQGKYGEAEVLYEKNLQIREKVLGEQHPDTIIAYDALAGVYFNQGKYSEAEVLYEKGLKIKEKILGKEHLDSATNYSNLAVVYYEQGRYSEAEALLKKGLKIKEKILGENHLDTAMSYNNLATLYFSYKKYELALSYYIRAFRICINKFGFEYPDATIYLQNMEITFEEWKPEGNFKQWLEEQMQEPEQN